MVLVRLISVKLSVLPSFPSLVISNIYYRVANFFSISIELYILVTTFIYLSALGGLNLIITPLFVK